MTIRAHLPFAIILVWHHRSLRTGNCAGKSFDCCRPEHEIAAKSGVNPSISSRIPALIKQGICFARAGNLDAEQGK
jgi:hypothetical protein